MMDSLNLNFNIKRTKAMFDYLDKNSLQIKQALLSDPKKVIADITTLKNEEPGYGAFFNSQINDKIFKLQTITNIKE